MPPPACRPGHRGVPLEMPNHATAPFPLASFSLFPSLYCSLSRTSPTNKLGHHGRRIAPPSRAPPSPAVVLRRSATPPSSSSPEESTGTARSHRRFAGFPRRSRSRRHQNPPPPVRLRPNQPRQSVPGEFPVRMGPSPASLVPRRRRR
jgi:hypothetical protein